MIQNTRSLLTLKEAVLYVEEEKKENLIANSCVINF